MRLKDILMEDVDNDRTDAEELHQVLRSDYDISLNEDQLLYRGVGREIGNYEERKIRKNREPRNTYPYLDELIYQMERVHGDEKLPRRRNSKFASKSRAVASEFGMVFICFFQKDADVVSFPVDTYEYFDEPGDFLHEVASDFYNISSDPEVATGLEPLDTFLDWLVRLVFDKTPQAAEAIAYYIFEDGEELIEQAERYEEKSQYHTQINLLTYALNNLLAYFNEYEYGVTGKADEVIFNGDKYILVREEFFLNYFVWNGTAWQLKKDK